jgi:hypothetical protein
MYSFETYIVQNDEHVWSHAYSTPESPQTITLYAYTPQLHKVYFKTAVSCNSLHTDNEDVLTCMMALYS